MRSGELQASISSRLAKMLRLVRNSRVSPKARIYPGSVFKNSSIGVYSYLSYFAFVNQTNIGRYCSIGMSLRSGLGTHPTNYLSTSPVFYSPAAPVARRLRPHETFVEHQPVSIGNDVWIGSGVTILDGVRIGDGAIIAAGCVVTKDVTPYSIIGGVPGRQIGTRFDDAVVQRLLSIRWWEYDIDKLPSETSDYLFTGAFTVEKLDALERHCRECGMLDGDGMS